MRALLAVFAAVLLLPVASAQPPPPPPPIHPDPAPCLAPFFPLLDYADACADGVRPEPVTFIYLVQVLRWLGCDIIGGPACL